MTKKGATREQTITVIVLIILSIILFLVFAGPLLFKIKGFFAS